MISEKQSPENAKKIVWIIWLAFTMASIIYVFVANILLTTWQNGNRPDVGQYNIVILAFVFGFVAVTCFVLGLYFRFGVKDKQIIKGLEKSARQRRIDFSELTPSHIIATAQTYCIMAGACFEACSIYGLILVILGADISYVYPFVAVSIIGLLTGWPRESFFNKFAQAHRDAVTRGK